MNCSSGEMLGVLLDVAEVLVMLDTILDTSTFVVSGSTLALPSNEDELLETGGGFMEENVYKVDWAPYITVEVQ